MSAEFFADVVIGIPYGSEGKKRWKKVGALLKMNENDASKGPGFVIMLDRYFNPAGVPVQTLNESSVILSTYWPDDKRPER